MLIFLIRPETLSSLKEWLKQLPSFGMDPVECGSLTLDEPHIAAIEKSVLDLEVGASCVHSPPPQLLSLAVRIRTANDDSCTIFVLQMTIAAQYLYCK